MSDWLNEIEVASPCGEDWAAMAGGERARHCASCKQDVYDLSGLTRAEGVELVRRAQGGEEICVRFRRRADGTVLTADCPSQVKRARVVRKGLRGVAASAAALLGGALAQGCEPNTAPAQTMTAPVAPLIVFESEVEVTSDPSAPDPAVGGAEACCEDGMGECCAPGVPASTDAEAKTKALDLLPTEACEEVMMGRMMAPPRIEDDPRKLLEAAEESAPEQSKPAGGRRLPQAEK